MATNISNFNWEQFWEGFDEDSEDIQDINGVIFRDKKGHWKTVVVIPNSFEVLAIPVYYDPFTGRKFE